MRRFQRGVRPAVLADKEEAWGLEWEERHAQGGAFSWRVVDKLPLNQHLLPALKEQTQDHCSFCDIFPVTPPSRDTIEHFKPKSRFPTEAFLWINLYYCCMHCQLQKKEKFDEDLLRPDAQDYSFDRYFRWDFTRGELLVNERGSDADRRRAKITIELYGLNQGHPRLRRREIGLWIRRDGLPLDDFAYRDFLEESDRSTSGQV